ncbi:hypothetical protein [Thalassoglobus sp.]|uniref:hypothetical protein n=1 Tax=Thalassoglobus sp. TaxID=2795869 RepID=UPI003AA8508D
MKFSQYLFVAVICSTIGQLSFAQAADEPEFQLASFSVDVTIPLNHRCMGLLPTKSKTIADSLEAIGFVLLSSEKPLVYVAIDWCEIRNGAYDQWRDGLAAAAGTTRERVLVSSLHQHDAPVTDADAAKLLEEVGLKGELYDETFHQQCIQNVSAALQESLKTASPVTHIGMGKAKVEKVASNRRIIMSSGAVSFGRGSASGGKNYLAEAPEGEIDPYLWTLSFWNNETPLLALHSYATHPMSYYGKGEVTSDFVGLARKAMQKKHPNIKQIYASGCSGDVTAGKFNNGSKQSRIDLTNRILAGMEKSWKATKKLPLTQAKFANTKLDLKYYDHAGLQPKRLRTILDDKSARTEDRIYAAMGLASYERVKSGQLIDFPCLDFGPAQLVLFPGESFVGYQLMAQQMRPDSFVLSIGYGECWPGYVPTNSAFADNFQDKWLWVGPGSENQMRAALQEVLPPKTVEE